MSYAFLVETYASERVKTLGVWSMFRDEDLDIRPHPNLAHDRTAHEHMVHQCLSEDKWFCRMFDMVALLSWRARTMPVRSPLSRVTPALSIATSVPDPIAIPTSAAASDGASLTPSPAIATTLPSRLSRPITAFF